MRAFQLALVCVLLFLQYQLWFGKNGIGDYTKLTKRVSAHKEVNLQLEKRNKLLKADIEDLKVGLEGIEERARNELGMIKPGEVFFRIVPNDEK